MPRWLDTTEKRVKVLMGALGLVGVLGSAALVVDARYAKADEVRQVRDKLEFIVLEIKISQLGNRLALLRAEERQLQATPKPTNLEAARLGNVQQELRDVEKEIDRLRDQQVKLQGGK